MDFEMTHYFWMNHQIVQNVTCDWVELQLDFVSFGQNYKMGPIYLNEEANRTF